MKRFTKSAQQSLSMHYKRGVPSKINNEFTARRVDAAFISSINSKKYRHVNLAIIAKKEVQSVLVIPHAANKNDTESATSNVLADILDIQGEVIIGDKALRYFLTGGEHIDLAKEWHKRYHLPFVFAVLCYHKDKNIYQKIEKKFLRTKVKIPRYILKQAAQRTSVAPSDILHYLEHISYKLDTKSQHSLKKFFTLSHKKGNF